MANVKAAMEYAAKIDREAMEKRLWVGLTDEEFHELQILYVDDPWANFKAIASKLKDKNT